MSPAEMAKELSIKYPSELEKMKLMTGEELALYEVELAGIDGSEKHKRTFSAQTDSVVKYFSKVVKELQKY
jgi:hypothetical protein